MPWLVYNELMGPDMPLSISYFHSHAGRYLFRLDSQQKGPRMTMETTEVQAHPSNDLHGDEIVITAGAEAIVYIHGMCETHMTVLSQQYARVSIFVGQHTTLSFS